jgi:hypothetical protein
MHDAGKVGRGDRCERARATAGKHGRRAAGRWLAGWTRQHVWRRVRVVGAIQGANGEGTAEELGSERRSELGSELTGQAAEARAKEQRLRSAPPAT